MSKGFFWPDRNAAIQAHKNPLLSRLTCAQCGLRRGCLHPCMPPSGKGLRGLYVVAEAPGVEEDKYNTQLIGECGQLFRKELKALGIDLDNDCRKTNAVCCRPPKNATPTPVQIDACRPIVWKDIIECKPKVVLLLGQSAIRSVISGRADGAAVWQYRDNAIPDCEPGGLNAWIVPTFHPAYLLRCKDSDVAWAMFRNDLKLALKHLDFPLPKPVQRSGIVVGDAALDCVHELQQRLKIGPMLVAVDYETTGKKPHAPGHRIVCAGLAYAHDKACAFMLDKETKPLLEDILSSPNCYKVTGNELMEISWTNWCLKRTARWVWDVVLAGHILDNREGCCNVKWLSWTNLGVQAYDKTTDKFLKDTEGGNSFNQIDRVAPIDLLTYCATDALVEYELALLQIPKFGWTIPKLFRNEDCWELKTGLIANA